MKIMNNFMNIEKENIIYSFRFVEKYQEIEKTGQYSNDEAIFRATEVAFEEEGITFLRNKKVCLFF